MSQVHPLVAELAAERERRGFPASWAGQRAGLSKNVVGQWERGVRIPHLTELSRYAYSLGYRLALTEIDRSVP